MVAAAFAAVNLDRRSGASAKDSGGAREVEGDDLAAATPGFEPRQPGGGREVP
jgi:hypothetical protein